MATIPLRELRNNASGVLRRVEAGERLTVTVAGRPVADLVPHEQRRRFVSRATLERILRENPPDPDFARDVDDALADTVDDL